MAGMVFGELPKLEAVPAGVKQFEKTINRAMNADKLAQAEQPT